jgi:hypothetical protein
MGKVKEQYYMTHKGAVGSYQFIEDEVDKGWKDQLSSMEEPATEALRFNDGKPPMGYVPMDCLEGAARVMEKGAKKYGTANYRKGYSDLMSPLSSLMRHTATLQRAIECEDADGEQGHLLDAESGEAHIHHVLTSAMILVQAMKLKGWKV